MPETDINNCEPCMIEPCKFATLGSRWCRVGINLNFMCQTRSWRRTRLVVYARTEQGQRTFPAKTFPERCHTLGTKHRNHNILVPNVLPQFRTLVRPHNPYLPLSLTLKRREEKREGRERAPLRDHRVSPATTSRVCRTSFRRTDRPLPPAGRVAPIPRWNERAIKSSKAIGERAARRTSAPPRAPDLWKAINDDAVIRPWQLQCGSFCSYRDCYLMGQSRTLGLFGIR